MSSCVRSGRRCCSSHKSFTVTPTVIHSDTHSHLKATECVVSVLRFTVTCSVLVIGTHGHSFCYSPKGYARGGRFVCSFFTRRNINR
jgi:hypothetical protein